MQEDKVIIRSIESFLKSSTPSKTELHKKVKDDTGEPRRKIKEVIDRYMLPQHEGGLWYEKKQKKNQRTYHLYI